MLTDRERIALHDIERGIQVQDPDFARSFQAIEQRHARHCFSWWMYTAAMSFVVLMSGLMLLAGLPAGTFMFAAATWAIALARRAHVRSVPRKGAVSCIPDGQTPGLKAAPQPDPSRRPRRGGVSERGVLAPIAVGVDGSAAGLEALAWAVAEAAARRRPLRIVHAVKPPLMPSPLDPNLDLPVDCKSRTAAQALLSQADEAARCAHPHLEVHSRLVVGTAPQALLEHTQDAELLVLGERGRRGFTGLFVASVGIEVATESPCPVVIVGSRSAHRAGPSAGRVVVGIDGGKLSSAVVDFAFQTAARRGVGVTGVYAWTTSIASYAGCDLAPVVTELLAADEQHLRLLLDAFARQRRDSPDVDVELKLVRARPAHALVAESAGAELVVVGAPRGRLFRGRQLGSVSRTVLHRAHCPVAVVRTDSQQLRSRGR